MHQFDEFFTYTYFPFSDSKSLKKKKKIKISMESISQNVLEFFWAWTF